MSTGARYSQRSWFGIRCSQADDHDAMRDAEAVAASALAVAPPPQQRPEQQRICGDRSRQRVPQKRIFAARPERTRARRAARVARRSVSAPAAPPRRPPPTARAEHRRCRPRRPPPAARVAAPRARISRRRAARSSSTPSSRRLAGKEVVVELKNDLAVRGTLHSVDQYLNIKLLNVSVDDVENYPHAWRLPQHPRLLPARRPTARAAAPPRRPARSPSRRRNR